ncbi:MAG: hypothetical protein LBL62_01560 [Planctomycetaceae bacterium]|nr:hypothetical protein [Planctomycetaceae bacterium]
MVELLVVIAITLITLEFQVFKIMFTVCPQSSLCPPTKTKTEF